MDGAEVAIFAYGSVGALGQGRGQARRAPGRRASAWCGPSRSGRSPRRPSSAWPSRCAPVIVPEMNIRQMSWEVQAAVRRPRQGRGLRARGRQADHARGDPRAGQAGVLLPPLGGCMSALVDEHRLEAQPTATPSCRASSRTPRRRSRRTCAPPRRSGARAAPTAPSPGRSSTPSSASSSTPRRSSSWPASAAAAASAPTSTTPPCTPRTGGRSRWPPASRRPIRRSTVIVAMGDGDCSAIGGNHFIHAARRNIDLTALVFNNSIYGMTGGQMSPTTHIGDKSTTSVLRQRRAGLRPLRAGACRGSHLRRPRHVLGLPAARQRHRRRHRPPRLLDGRGDGHLPHLLRPVQPHGRPGRVPAQPEGARGAGGKYDEGETRSHDHYPVGLLHHREREEYVSRAARAAGAGAGAGR